jgi:hypothetical protein
LNGTYAVVGSATNQAYTVPRLETIYAPQGTSNLSFDLSTYSPGLYLLSFETADGKKAVKKVVRAQ